jgi:FAD/FMN-containing dehydrogenase
MDARQTRLVEDLAGVFRGELACDQISTSLYASDGSLHQITPMAVACPLDGDDLATLVTYAAEQNLPLVARGAGTSVGGEALGSGIIVDFARHMNAIEHVNDQTVRVQPGVVHSVLNRTLAKTGRCFAPDPSNSATTTIGSMLALDAAGSHSIRIGSTRDHVISIDAMLASKARFTAELEPLNHLAADGSNGSLAKREIVSQLAILLAEYAELIGEKQPASLPRNRAGWPSCWSDRKEHWLFSHRPHFESPLYRPIEGRC